MQSPETHAQRRSRVAAAAIHHQNLQQFAILQFGEPQRAPQLLLLVVSHQNRRSLRNKDRII